jgi:hypothetical protein
MARQQWLIKQTTVITPYNFNWKIYCAQDTFAFFQKEFRILWRNGLWWDFDILQIEVGN